MNDKEIWKNSFSDKEEIDKFDIKPGPPLTEEQIKAAKIKREEEKEKKIIESLENRIKILEEDLEACKKLIKNFKQKPKTQRIEIHNESKTTKKQAE